MWAASKTPAATQVTRLYLETCVLAAQDPARWSPALERLRGPWRAPLHSGLVAFGLPPRQATTMTDLILDTLDGLSLDRLVATDVARVDAAAEAFAQFLDREA